MKGRKGLRATIASALAKSSWASREGHRAPARMRSAAAAEGGAGDVRSPRAAGSAREELAGEMRPYEIDLFMCRCVYL